MTQAGPLRYVGDAVPYTYIGDSHAGAIGSHVFDDMGDGSRIVTRTFGIWRLVAADILGPDGMIGEEFMQALRMSGAFHSSLSFEPVAGLRPVLTTYGHEKREEYLAVTESANERPYVLCVGEIDTRYVLYRLAEDGDDFDVPFPIGGLERLPAFDARQIVRSDDMLRFLATLFKSLFLGLRILHAAGLRTLFLHCLPPPAVDDDDALRVLRHSSPALLRYKLAMFVNYMYDAVCRDIGIGFINTWPMVTEGNLLLPQYYLDGLHLNRDHAVLSVSEVRRQLAASRSIA